MKLVSRCWMSTRMKDISLRVFSKMMRGSSDWQRRQLGAITMARLLTSILVTATLAGCTNTCRGGGKEGGLGQSGAASQGTAESKPSRVFGSRASGHAESGAGGTDGPPPPAHPQPPARLRQTQEPSPGRSCSLGGLTWRKRMR